MPSSQHGGYTSGRSMPHGMIHSPNVDGGNRPSPCSHVLGEEEEEDKDQPQQAGCPPELPDGWGMLTSHEGHSYYVFYPTGKTQWERPVFSPKDRRKLDTEEPPPFSTLSYKGIDRV